MLRGLSLLLVLATPAIGARDVIIDHDGDFDDLVAVELLARSPDFAVRAITICPGDSYLEQATRATQLFLDRLGARNIAIAQGHSDGINPFPAQWRADAGRILDLPALAGKAEAHPPVADDAAHLLVKLLSGKDDYTILETGPLTNIADALRLEPAIKRHIARIYVMGGAVRVKGNVEQQGHDGSAEWNMFNHPRAAAEVIGSGIPITLIPLDATNHAPLSRAFVDRLARQPSIASQLAAQSWQLALKIVGPDQYYFWDTLTAAALIDPAVVRTERLKIKVITEGASQGRTIEDASGTPVDVALDASRDKVEQTFLRILGR